jgi:hypothetical protein
MPATEDCSGFESLGTAQFVGGSQLLAHVILRARGRSELVCLPSSASSSSALQRSRSPPQASHLGLSYEWASRS